MKKVLILLVVLALMVPVLVSAQEAGSTDNQIFGVHFGFIGGYSLDAEELVAGQDFGLNFTLSDTMQIGFRAIDGIVNDASLLNFGYFLSPEFCVDLMVGADAAGNTVGGIDAALYLFRSEDEDAFSSSLKLKAGYIFDENLGIDSGVVNTGLIGTVGY